jgi:putative phosphoribosyl transferase
MTMFANRSAAGRQLASRLSRFRSQPDLLVLGLPRGGVPVATEVARALNARFDVMVVRRMGASTPAVPAIGAVAAGGEIVLNDGFDDVFDDAVQLRKFAARELIEISRCVRRYRGDRPALPLENTNVILVDDGAVTGASMLAAIRTARTFGVREVTVALPIASAEARRRLEAEADHVICLVTIDELQSMPDAYLDCAPLSDSDVCALMNRSSIALATA